MEDTGCSSRFRRFYVVICPFVVSIMKLSNGFVIGWSTILPKIQMDNSTSLEVTENDVQWLVSLTGITGVVLVFFTGLLIEYFGPRRILSWMLFFGTASWFTMAFTTDISLLYLGRVVQSITYIFMCPLTPILISEYSDPKIRGFMLSMDEVLVSLGILIKYAMAQELYWVTSTALCGVVAIVQCFNSIFLPESPFWLARNGQQEKAKKSLMKVRFCKAKAAEEMTDLLLSTEKTKQSTVMDQVRQLKHGQNYRPIIFIVSVFTLREFGGANVIFSYSVYIFEEAGVKLDPFMCTIFGGLTRTIATIISAFIIDWIGRRPLIITTTCICGLATLICSLFLLIELPGTSWVPLAALLLYLASYGFGLGPIPWGLLGEMIPTSVRPVGGSICIFGFSLSTFSLSYLFPQMITCMGIGFTFLIYSAFHLVLFIILIRWFPETKGKTLNEMEFLFISNTELKQKFEKCSHK